MRPRVIKLTTEEADCPGCQTAVRSTHPLQVSLAEGAAGVQLGPRALGVAAQLNKQHGLTMRKTCKVLQELFQLRSGRIVAGAGADGGKTPTGL